MRSRQKRNSSIYLLNMVVDYNAMIPLEQKAKVVSAIRLLHLAETLEKNFWTVKWGRQKWENCWALIYLITTALYRILSPRIIHFMPLSANAYHTCLCAPQMLSRAHSTVCSKILHTRNLTLLSTQHEFQPTPWQYAILLHPKSTLRMKHISHEAQVVMLLFATLCKHILCSIHPLATFYEMLPQRKCKGVIAVFMVIL